LDRWRIDGSYGEAGGQIIRTSISMSILNNIPIQIENIRAKRENVGLHSQHVKMIKSIAEIYGANVENLHLGSDWIKFTPKLDKLI